MWGVGKQAHIPLTTSHAFFLYFGAMSLARRLLIRASRSPWLAEQFRRRAFARRAVRRFLPGEDLGAAPEVGVCLQAYLRRTPKDLEGLLPLRPAIRLVKGAYSEPSHVAFPKKADVDLAYFALAERLLAEARASRATPDFGTHDERLIERI